MSTEQKTAKRISLNGGGLGNPIFLPPKESKFYDEGVFRQCTVPIKSREKLEKKLVEKLPK